MLYNIINKVILLSVFLIFSSALLSQEEQNGYFDYEVDSLNILFSSLSNTDDDFVKINIGNSIFELVEYMLYDENSFDYSFDSIQKLGVIKSEDELLRIYTWNLIFSDNTYKYFGFIQYLDNKTKEYLIYELVDKSDSIINPEKQILSNENWYGALYYKIIENDGNNYKYYTLLGWDGNNEWSTKKIIDVLYFNSAGKPRFGANIFTIEKQGDRRRKQVRQKRIFFEYNSKVNMTLTYNYNMNMIVFDHLSPNDSSNSDDFRYYGPDWKYSGLKFKKNKWDYYPDIDPRNPKPDSKPAKWKYKNSEDVFGQ